MSKSRLFVFQLKEIIYTGIFVLLGIVLIIIFIAMFSFNKKSDADNQLTEQTYKPGVYTTQLSLNNVSLNIEVTVDSNNVNSVAITNLNESVTTMYPLLEPSVDSINTQLNNGVPIDSITVNSSSQYTESLLVDAVKNALEKAQ